MKRSARKHECNDCLVCIYRLKLHRLSIRVFTAWGRRYPDWEAHLCEDHAAWVAARYLEHA